MSSGVVVRIGEGKSRVEALLNTATHGHGDSMTESAQRGRFSENRSDPLPPKLLQFKSALSKVLSLGTLGHFDKY